MKKIINWVKHEYRIYRDIDKPTYRDYCIITFLYFFVCIPLSACLLILFSIILSVILPSLNDTIATFAIALIWAILMMFIVCPMSELVDKNAYYDSQKL